MKLRLLSDLHLEAHPFAVPFLPDDPETILVLAGDICQFNMPRRLLSFIRECCSQFRAVIHVPGNHEYYGSVWPDARDGFAEYSLPENYHLLDRKRLDVDDVAFLGATLWTDADDEDPVSKINVSTGLYDYEAIGLPDKSPTGLHPPLTIEHTIADHKQSRAWLEAQIPTAKADSKKVVMVTHHGVSPQSIHQQYAGNPFNGGFVSDLRDLILEHQPQLVVHGHVHNSFDYTIGTTRVVVNPRGYPHRIKGQENAQFNPTLHVVV